MSIAVCILAKDEGRTIVDSLVQLSKQSLVRDALEDIEIHVVANGCTDNTVDAARSCQSLFGGSRAKLHVHDLHPGGKSRAWNRTVHELVGNLAAFYVFIDADIAFANDAVVDDMLASLRSRPHLVASCGFPVKDASAKAKKSLLDRFSLIVSEQSTSPNSINGSLYAARAEVIRETWLPDETPGEDGFLNAMLTTRGFTRLPDPTVIIAPNKPTHSFHTHGPLEFVNHERRMIVGTMINRWIFEHLWSLGLALPAGPLIRDWNKTDPGWVSRIVRQRAQSGIWLIPNAILFSRWKGRVGQSWWKHAAYVPIAAAATLLTLPPAILANKRLKEVGAATTW